MNILVTICARGGSKGIPGKNIKELNGLPLIGYSIKIAKEFAGKYGADILLSTDSEEIKSVASKFDLITDYTRPEFLASDQAGKVDAIRDALTFAEKTNCKHYDYVLDLDVTSPLRTLDDLERAFELIKKNNDALSLFSVSQAHKNPYFNMVEENEDGYYSLVCQADTVLSRQKAPNVYELNASFYFYKDTFFVGDYKGPITDKSLIFKMDHICFDVDEPIDFEFLNFLAMNNKLDSIL